MTEPTSMQLVPTEELLDEIMSRYDTAVFIAQAKTTETRSRMTFMNKGTKLQLLGLSKWFDTMSERMLFEDQEEDL